GFNDSGALAGAVATCRAGARAAGVVESASSEFELSAAADRACAGFAGGAWGRVAAAAASGEAGWGSASAATGRSGRIAIVRTSLGSLPTTPLPNPDCGTACDKTTVAGLSIGCSSRDTNFSLWPRSFIRSLINLLDCASLPLAAGTILLGPASALITGGGWLDADEPNNAR